MWCALRVALLPFVALLGTTAANALTFSLVSEFDGIEPDAAYASVEVTQNGDDLDFVVTLGGMLGGDEDLHELYFNLVGTFTGLEIVVDDAPTSPYTLSGSAVSGVTSVAGGAGSGFDLEVNFGNGAGPRGNGNLGSASFTLSANEALGVADLLETSVTSGGIEAHMAVHVQSTWTAPGSETVGGVVVPEPAAGALLLAASIAVWGRRARKR